MEPSSSIGFLNIPLELRRQIYQYCLVHDEPIVVRHLLGNPYSPGKPQPLHPNILRVSKQISHEAMEVLYGENTFHVSLESGSITSLQSVFTYANRLRIRKLQLVINDNDQIWQSLRFWSNLWSSILSGLKTLTIVVKQPLKTDTVRRIPSLPNWINWVKPMVGYMAEQLSSSAHVEVDDDNREEIGVVMQEAFPGGYRKVRTKFGNTLFRRRALAVK